jgi:hypothetical protein
MTTIITRLYADSSTARSVVSSLIAQGHAQDTVDVITRDGAGDLAERLKASRVRNAAASAYAPAIEGGNALVVVRAPFAPMGAARHAMKIVDRTASIKVGVADENDYVREQPRVEVKNTLIAGNPLVMSNPHRGMTHEHILGKNPVLAPRTRRSTIAGGKFMSRMFWPMRLVSANAKQGNSAIRGGWLVSSMFGLPTLLK